MSEMSKKARSDMRAKAVRLAGGGIGSNDPAKPVDASSWRPPEGLDAGRKTGARPIRPRIYKHGGKIQGDRAPRNPGKACRGGGFASGGRTGTGPLSMANVADENKREFGSFHEGGYKNGGSAGKPHWIKDAVGHPGALHKKLGVPEGKKIPAKKLVKAEHSKNPTEAKEANLAKTLRSFHAKGGKVDPAAHEKAGTFYGGTRPTGGRMPRADGGAAKVVVRPYSLEKDRVGQSTGPDQVHAFSDAPSAMRHLNGMIESGKTGPGYHEIELGGKRMSLNAAYRHHFGEDPVDTGKGYRYPKLRSKRAHGGRAKGKTNINIVIAQPKAGGGPMGAQQMPPQGVVRPPMPPPQMAPPAGGPPPMPMPPPGGPPGGMPPGAGPMMRAKGGRANADAIPLKGYGSNSGLGRLEKIKIQERSHR